MPTQSSTLWAFDFDGVVCDSVGESSQTAWKASEQQWPEIFKDPKVQSRQEEVLDAMHAVRPVVETGYENLIQVRALLEGVSVDDILQNWGALLPQCMRRWGAERAPLVERFGAMRDAWMTADLTGWLDANAIYMGLPALLQHAIDNGIVYIVTTKQARFTEALLHKKAGVALPAERIISTTMTGQPKSDILKELQSRHPGRKYHFVEDKLSTLEKVCKEPDLEHWRLYLVDWGYNTAAERAQAAASPRIQVVSKTELERSVGCS